MRGTDRGAKKCRGSVLPRHGTVWARLFRAVLGGVMLGRLFRVMGRVEMMTTRGVRMVRGFLVMASRVVFLRLLMMSRGVFVMFRRFPVMFCTLFTHNTNVRPRLKSATDQNVIVLWDGGCRAVMNSSPSPRRQLNHCNRVNIAWLKREIDFSSAQGERSGAFAAARH